MRQPLDSPTTALAVADRSDVEAYYRTIAPFYDAELADRPDLDFWRWVAERHRGDRLLELGCGTGRVTAVLAPPARELLAVDLSPELLRIAGRRLTGAPQVRLLRADMLTLDLDEPFDLIVAADDPLSHLVSSPDRDLALQVVARHLASGGRFVLDALWLSPKEARAVASDGGRVRRRTASMQGQPLRVVERWERQDGHGPCCHARYEYQRPGYRAVVAAFEARDWSPLELFERLGRAGLVVTNVWGSYEREPWNPDISSQLIVEARRPLTGE